MSNNNSKIQNAFKRARKNTQAKLQSGMEYLLEWGMRECLRCHDSRHRNHIDMGDGYGWILYKDRAEVSRRAYAGWGASILNVNEGLDAFKVDSDGWVGVVMATMKPRYYFVKRLEIAFMQSAFGNLKGLDFNNVFRRA